MYAWIVLSSDEQWQGIHVPCSGPELLSNDPTTCPCDHAGYGAAIWQRDQCRCTARYTCRTPVSQGSQAHFMNHPSAELMHGDQDRNHATRVASHLITSCQARGHYPPSPMTAHCNSCNWWLSVVPKLSFPIFCPMEMRFCFWCTGIRHPNNFLKYFEF